MTEENKPLGTTMSREQRLHTAKLATAALPFMQVLTQALSAKYYRQWVQSKPEHRNEREGMHTKQIVLDEMGKLTQMLIQDGEQVLHQMQAEESPEAKEKERLDTEGFGLNFDNRGATS